VRNQLEDEAVVGTLCAELIQNTRWFKYDRDDLCVNKSQFVPVIFEPPCNLEVFASSFSFCKSAELTSAYLTAVVQPRMCFNVE
jgi:hypothetical protein